jgi:hypothetical protein
MLVRIRWERRSAIPPQLQEVALALAALLTPFSLVAFTLALWNIAADLRWLGEFFISRGLFSHWQVWLILAATLLLVARLLDRYAGPQQDLAS